MKALEGGNDPRNCNALESKHMLPVSSLKLTFKDLVGNKLSNPRYTQVTSFKCRLHTGL